MLVVENGNYVHGLAVIDFANDDSYGLRLEPGQKRFHDESDLTPRWFAHYYRWTRDASGRERLVERADAKPLPWIGRIERDPSSSSLASDGTRTHYDIASYRLRAAKEGLAPVFTQFLVERFGAKRAADPWQGATAWNVPQCPLPLRLGFLAMEEPPTLELSTDGDLAARAQCTPVVEAIARAFDAELASGKHQALFID